MHWNCIFFFISALFLCVCAAQEHWCINQISLKLQAISSWLWHDSCTKQQSSSRISLEECRLHCYITEKLVKPVTHMKDWLFCIRESARIGTSTCHLIVRGRSSDCSFSKEGQTSWLGRSCDLVQFFCLKTKVLLSVPLWYWKHLFVRCELRAAFCSAFDQISSILGRFWVWGEKQ